MQTRRHKLLIIVVALLLGAGPLCAASVQAAQITSRSLQLSSNKPGEHTVTYGFDFTIPTAGSMDSVVIEFCGNSALVEDTCVAPWGLDALNATFASQVGLNGFIKSASSNVNTLVLSHAPGNVQSAGAVSATFDNITNPTDADSYYVKIFTYPTTDGSGPYTDFGALAFSINAGFDVSAEVPPFLTFCQGITIDNFDCSTATGDQINLGELSSATASMGTSQLLMATNASSGYTVQVSGITMTSGNNEITPMLDTFSHIGTSQFGINLVANTNPVVGQNATGPGSGAPIIQYGTVNRFRFQNNESIAKAINAQDYKKYTVSYLVNVAKGQAPGVYSTTLTYICVANF